METAKIQEKYVNIHMHTHTLTFHTYSLLHILNTKKEQHESDKLFKLEPVFPFKTIFSI